MFVVLIHEIRNFQPTRESTFLSIGRENTILLGTLSTIYSLQKISKLAEFLRGDTAATMKSIPISVVMSVFNGQAFLVEAIESILGQTFRDFEFVIVDDGSTDSPPEILNRFAKQDERIRIHRHANKGRAESLNIGIALANGEYIARMDADGISLRIRLEEQVRFMEEHPDVGLLGGGFELISDD